MAAETLTTFIRQLTRSMAAETLSGQSDRQLVEQCLAGRDEAVFEALVRRHGPMVYRVCRRVLRQPQDVEDAFQVTFLVLAQNLRSVRKHASLASWLHGVARRVALKAQAQAACRRRHERQAPASPAGPPDEATWGELRWVLDAELTGLPEKWRQPLILCYLEGRTQDEAAGQLGWSKATLRRRLDEAREALGRRLRRRGVWPTALSAVLLVDSAIPAALPQGLVEAAVKTAAGRASAAVAALADEVTKTLSLHGIPLAVALLTTVGGLVAAAGISAPGVWPCPPTARATTDAPPPVKVPQAHGPHGFTADALAGRWLMTMPAGFTYQVTVRPVSETCVSLENAVRFSGVYELRAGRLVLVKPQAPAEKEFEWEVRGAGQLALVAQPPVPKVGSNYLGATLKRRADDTGLVARAGKDGADGGPAPEVPRGPDPAQANTPPDRIAQEVFTFERQILAWPKGQERERDQALRAYFAGLKDSAHKIAAIGMTDSRYVYAVPRNMGSGLVGPLLNDPDLQVRLRAARALGLYGKDHYDALVRLLKDAPGRQRGTVITAMGRANDPRFLPHLRALLKDDDGLVRASAVAALAGYPREKVIDDVLALWDDPHERVRFNVMQYHTNARDKDGLALTLKRLDDVSPLVREGAVRNLGSSGQQSVAKAVAGLLNDTSPHVRARAAEALGELRAREYAAALVRQFSDTAEDVVARRYALLGFEKVGTAEHLPQVRKLLNDEDAQLRELAVRIVKILERGQPPKDDR